MAVLVPTHRQRDVVDMKLDWIKSSHCKSGAHCNTCRELEGGRAWRISIGKAFALPEEGVDFECPYELAWGDVGTAPAVPESSLPRIATAANLPFTHICQNRTCASCSTPAECKTTTAVCPYGPGTFDQCSIWREMNRQALKEI